MTTETPPRRPAAPRRPPGLAETLRQYGERWEIEHMDHRSEWIAVLRETEGDYIRIVGANTLGDLHYKMDQVERDEPEDAQRQPRAVQDDLTHDPHAWKPRMSDDTAIDRLSIKHAYQQVADALTARIADGRYPFKLPSERALAEEFGVSYPTVRHAMAILRERGLVVSVLGRGTLIAPDPGDPTTGSATSPISSR